jgi:hypothetical protein
VAPEVVKLTARTGERSVAASAAAPSGFELTVTPMRFIDWTSAAGFPPNRDTTNPGVRHALMSLLKGHPLT